MFCYDESWDRYKQRPYTFLSVYRKISSQNVGIFIPDQSYEEQFWWNEKDIFMQWGWTILTFRNIMLHLHDKDTTSETSITKWYFSAMGMNNLYIPKYHAPNTQQRYNFWIKHQKMIFCGNGMNNLYIPKYHMTKIQLLQTSIRRFYFRQWGWTILRSEISCFKCTIKWMNNPNVRSILSTTEGKETILLFYDEYLINIWIRILLQFLLLPDKKTSTMASLKNICRRVMQSTRWVQPLRIWKYSV